LPLWLAVIVQVPAATAVTVLPTTAQVLVVALANVTGRPEVAVALAVVVPPTSRVLGVKVMVPMVWAVNALTVTVAETGALVPPE
jgi:hypothetical protein